MNYLFEIISSKPILIVILLSNFFQVLSQTSEIAIVAGGNGRGDLLNQLDYPSGIVVMSNGDVLVADLLNSRVQKWSPNAKVGVTIAGGNGSGNGANQLNFPRGLVIDQDDNLFVVDSRNHRVQKYLKGTNVGITVAGGNGQGLSSTQLSLPMGIDINENGDIFIADTHNLFKNGLKERHQE
jgi:DNA-binding beta-propeller fold protein YncE